MNTKFKNSKEVRKAFQDLLSFKSDEEEIKHQAQMVMFRFLSEIEALTEENNMTRKELACKIGTSPSYLTQLFRGSKPLNMITIAKFQKVFDITFNIKSQPNTTTKETSRKITGRTPQPVMKQMVNEPSAVYSKKSESSQKR
ncbi:MAG: helix-turn-helix transcriptional regulator [Bacteroidetes bacterium]|nr:helix-turn-helix transcriptional regulator [Bacteroidota bacterium]